MPGTASSPAWTTPTARRSRRGGCGNESKDLPALAANRWTAFQDDETGRGSALAFVVIGLLGLVMGLVLTLVPDYDDLQDLAWSAPLQTIRTALSGALLWAWSPLLLGHDTGVLQLPLIIGSFVLVLLVYVITSVRSLN